MITPKVGQWWIYIDYTLTALCEIKAFDDSNTVVLQIIATNKGSKNSIELESTAELNEYYQLYSETPDYKNVKLRDITQDLQEKSTRTIKAKGREYIVKNELSTSEEDTWEDDGYPGNGTWHEDDLEECLAPIADVINPIHNPDAPSTQEELDRAWEITKLLSRGS